MKKLLFATALAVLPAISAADVYKCDTRNKGRGGWIAPVYLVAIDPEKDLAAVLDGMIKEVYGEFIAARLRKRSETSYKVNWKVEGFKASNGGKGTNTYTMTMYLDTGKFTLHGQRKGYDNHISGSGTCKQLE